MALTWDTAPKNGSTVFFSRDMYEKYSLAPSLKDLWLMAHSPTIKSEETPAQLTEENTNLKPECPTSRKQDEKSTADPIPEPRVPFPCLSRLTEREQKTYLRLMTINCKYKKQYELRDHQDLQTAVNEEVVEFQKFLQNAAKFCASDYEIISGDAARYTEEYLRACIKKVKIYPAVYLMHEMTCITGGKFNPELTLKLEKPLLTLGEVRMTKAKFSEGQVQLITDYSVVASLAPPEKAACNVHADISCDSNAEKLSLKYNPQVSITSEALFTLLNNHGPDYKDSWEIPVCIKTVPGEGTGIKKLAFIDSPLPKKEMTTREKNHIFHKETFNLLMNKISFMPVSGLVLDKQAEENVPPWKESGPRATISFDNVDVDFETDFTDLETFGTSSSSSLCKKPKSQSNQIKAALSTEFKRPQSLPSQPGSTSEVTSNDAITEAHKVTGKDFNQKKLVSGDVSGTDSEDGSQLEDSSVNEVEEENAIKTASDENVSDTCPEMASTCSGLMSASQENQEPEGSLFSIDSDEERLVIDDGSSSVKNDKTLSKSPSKMETSVSDQIPDTPRSPSPEPNHQSSQDITSPNTRGRKRGAKRPIVKKLKTCDQLGEILKMQCKLLKPSTRTSHEPASPKATPGNLSATTRQCHPEPIVKPNSQGVAADPSAGSFQSVWQQKVLLPDDLLLSEDKEGDYETPQEGNLVYKLFSLADVLLMVRSSVHKALNRYRRNSTRKLTPVCVLPKVEYQVCYGVEALTKSEICHMWTQRLLHSNTTFFVGHIDAFTSKLFMMEEFTPDRIADKFGDFKPVNSLNILHHLLKKVIGLQEGKYLLSHKAGDPLVTIFKDCDGKTASRATYNLHRAHSSLPEALSPLSVPWVPLDPSLLLPYHLKHGIVPCTFPPRGTGNMQGQEAGVARGNMHTSCDGKAVAMETKSSQLPAQLGGNKGGAGKKKRNKGKKIQQRLKWKERCRQKRQQNN
ncbi:little elongation complex subunit 2 [Polyodon spathula]|uniref:little elongation complex subunit 2 n=1 Tax=Polyodon spathula TaxID=7913 RepID=UPI001B7EAD1C|nr:little elongation complex subunit 2 [Polyodon spathula]